VVLAIDTQEITAGKKNIANSVTSSYHRLFSPMEANRSYIKMCIYPAESCSAF
jgi:hypothetical protein